MQRKRKEVIVMPQSRRDRARRLTGEDGTIPSVAPEPLSELDEFRARLDGYDVNVDMLSDMEGTLDLDDE